MRTLLFAFLLSACLLCPQDVLADGGHYATWRSSRRGSETQRIRAAAEFLWHWSGRNPAESDAVLCSMRKIVPADRDEGLKAIVIADISLILKRPKRDVAAFLLGNSCPDEMMRLPKVSVTKMIMFVDQKGAVLSSNPVWNACIRGLPLTASFMKRNPDTVEHRQRRIRVYRPLSCRDYHKGDVRAWRYPEDPSVELVLDDRGRLLGDAPQGYVLQTVRMRVEPPLTTDL